MRINGTRPPRLVILALGCILACPFGATFGQAPGTAVSHAGAAGGQCPVTGLTGDGIKVKTTAPAEKPATTPAAKPRLSARTPSSRT